MIAAWWSWFSAVSLQAAALLVVVLIVDTFLRQRGWLAVRAALWSSVLARLLLPPDLAAPWSLAADLTERAAIDWNQTRVGDESSFVVLAFGAWLAGVAFIGVRGWRARRSLEHVVTGSRSAPEHVERELARLSARIGLTRVPRVRVSDAFAGPAVFELGGRAFVVLPGTFVEPARMTEREHALHHELAHLVRRDLLVARIVAIVHALFWFHPAAWIASRRLAELRELGADARVAVGLGERASEYRAALLEAASRRHGVVSASSVSTFLSGPSLLLIRLSRLDRPLWRASRLERPAGFAAFAGLALFVLPMACELPRRAGLDPIVAAALERWERAVASAERQNCLEVQAAARILAAHAQLTGEDLTQRIP